MSEEEEEGRTEIDTSQINEPPTTNGGGNSGGQSGGKKRDGLYLVIIILLILSGGFLAYLISEKNKSLRACGDENANLIVEMESLNEMMHEEGLAVGEDVKSNLQGMLDMYNSMEVDNEEMADSINVQKDKISGLMEELESVKNDKKRYASTVYRLQKETTTLRSIMKDYVRTIDSLNIANDQLSTDLNLTREDLSSARQDLSNVKQERDDLSAQVNKGSKLIAFNFLSEGIKERGSGSFKPTTRAKSCTHIRTCFRIGDNKISQSGDKTLFMRIITPGGSVLYSNKANTFQKENGVELIYSDKKAINYQNQATDVCIFHKLTQEIQKGNYIAEIYCEGVKIGSDNFVLK